MSNDFMDGMMGTHDEDTLDYFADTDVHVVLAPRSSSKGIDSLILLHLLLFFFTFFLLSSVPPLVFFYI